MSHPDKWVDLHVHSCFSDGLLTPTEIIHHAKRRGLAGIGIVDHDTIDGIAEAIEAARNEDICVVPGVEFSTHMDGIDIHIIGYFLDEDNAELNNYLRLFREERMQRAHKMVQNLQDSGVKISIDEVLEKSQGSSIGRPHMAEVLMEKGYVETFQEAFNRYIGYHSDSYVKKYTITPEKAIQLIYESRGISVLAHPNYLITDEMISKFIKSGLDGMEVVHPNLNDSRSRYLQHLVSDAGLMMFGGSDCHGGRNGSLIIGNYKIPYQIITEMLSMLKEKWNKTIDYCQA